MNHLIRAGLGLACVVAVGCVGGDGGGGGGGAGGGGNLSQFEGIYTITSYTENTTGCDAPGESILDEQDPMLANVAISFFFQPVLTTHTCVDLDDCRAVAADAEANNVVPFFGGFIFESASGTVANGKTITAGTDFETDQCQGSVVEHTLTLAEDGSFTLESRTTESATFAPDSEGFCNTEDAEAAANGQPCTEVVTIQATFTEALP